MKQKSKRISLLEVKLKSMIQEVSIEMLRGQFVDSNKITPETFENIVKASKNKSAYATWLVKNVSEKYILEEDIYKFEEYFDVFNKHKNKFTYKDINGYKGKTGANEFKRDAVRIMDEVEQFSDQTKEVDSSSLVSMNDIDNLKKVGIEYLGIVDGYQIFEVPQGNNSQEAYKRYKNILGKCKDGGKIHLCTVANYSHYKQYIDKDSLFVIFNLSDPKSPYQLHYESESFMDRNDEQVS
jgi:hypothetical protein